MKMKRIIALVLVCLMVLPMVVACGSRGKKNSDENKNNNENVNVTESNSVVPEDLKFPGETFTILCREDNAWGQYLHEISADEDATELVNEAVYRRNLEVEERFELEKLEAYAIPGQWAVGDDFVNKFRNSILSNSGTFDLIMSHQAYMSSDPSLNELYINLYDVPYIKDNLKADYYFPDVVKELTVNDRLYFLVGDLSLTYWEFAYVLFFNKTLAQNNNIEDIYTLVRDGKWTYDKMVEMTKGAWVDLNGDLWPGEEDTYGYVSDIPNTTDALAAHFDVFLTGRNENNDIVFNVDQGKMVNILEKFIELKKSDDTYFVYTTSADPEDANPADKMFREGRSLFYHATLERAQDFRGMETDFGIVPYPKWNENQEIYQTQAQDGYSVGVIPMDVTNVEMCGAVVDVLSALSSEMVIPAYYDMALKDKYSRDNDSGEMLDIIREGFTVNFGYFYGPALGCQNIFRQLIQQENSNFVSYYAVSSKGYERNLKKMYQAYSDEE